MVQLGTVANNIAKSIEQGQGAGDVADHYAVKVLNPMYT